MHPRRNKSLTLILNPNKASGPDGISNKMLKPAAKVSVPLGILFYKLIGLLERVDLPTLKHVIPLSKRVTTLSHVTLDQFHFYAG